MNRHHSLMIWCLVVLAGICVQQIDCSIEQSDVVLVEEVPERVILLIDETGDINGGGTGLVKGLTKGKKLGLLALLAFMPVRQPNGIILPLLPSIMMNIINMLNMNMINPTTPTPCVVPACPPQFTGIINGNCYFYSNDGALVEEARTACQMMNAVLWEPETLEEAVAVTNLFNIGTTEVWTGATEAQFGGAEGNPRFQSGNGLTMFAQIVTTTPCRNQRNRRDCVSLLFDMMLNDFVWCFRRCARNLRRRYVCEYPRPTCP